MALLYPQDVEAGAALLTLAECRAQCRVDSSDEDDFLRTLAAAAQSYVEAHTGRRLTLREAEAVVAGWPAAGVWRVMAAPVQQVLGIDYDDADGQPQSLPTGWQLRQRVDLSEIVFSESLPAVLPGSAIRVRLEVGYANGECPPGLKSAVLVKLASLYDNRSAGEPLAARLTVEGLMDPWRITKGGM